MKKGGINNDNQQLKFIATIQEKIFFKEETLSNQIHCQ